MDLQIRVRLEKSILRLTIGKMIETRLRFIVQKACKVESHSAQ